ncbi:MAG: Rpn family recombination-promoting nuclease/putative transposase, partial [Tannerella sp.]|jgi:predicted transposase/invertase (TIGR01784 family)|nr:Rpn family recombination-promoting nuclease/putative transposase [Tannerella sp.]
MLTDTETHKVFYDKLKFVYLEMPKFTKEVDELETRFEKWMYVLKNLKRLDAIPEKLRERIFERIFATAEIAKLTPEEYRDYVDNLNSYRDLKNALDYAEAKGRAEGKVDERIEIAKNAKVLGFTIEQIQKITNLSIDEIKKL